MNNTPVTIHLTWDQVQVLKGYFEVLWSNSGTRVRAEDLTLYRTRSGLLPLCDATRAASWMSEVYSLKGHWLHPGDQELYDRLIHASIQADTPGDPPGDDLRQDIPEVPGTLCAHLGQMG